MKFATKLLHDTAAADKMTGCTTPPVYQTAAFAHKSAEEMEKIFAGKKPGYIYTRVGNPTVTAFEQRVNFLEGGCGAVAASSGMAAISLAVLNLVQSGDEIISGSALFGGTYSFFSGLSSYGIKTIYAEKNTTACFENKITEKTKLIYLESIGNPKLNVPDIAAFAELAHKHGIPLLVDNTAATPYLLQPLKCGADIVVHSATKFINGGGNSIGGIIIDSGKFKWNADKFPQLRAFIKYGPFAYLAGLRKKITDSGGCMAPFNAFLMNVGLDTLTLRMDKICDNALKLAEFLENRSEINNVSYPGLPSNPDYTTAKNLFHNKFGGILTVRAGTKEKAFALINSLRYVLNASNLGDVRTLIIHPASTIYAGNDEKEKFSAGVYDDLLRICVGIEDIEDLQEDFAQALGKI